MNSKSISFLHDGHEYTVRTTVADNGWVIGVFKDNHPCPMVEHILPNETLERTSMEQLPAVLNHAMQVAKEEFERYLEQDPKC